MALNEFGYRRVTVENGVDIAVLLTGGHPGAASLPNTLADEIDPSVRDKYLELWRAAQAHDPE